MLRRITALTGAALAAMVVAGPAVAAGPTIVRNDIAFFDHVDCGDFGDFDFSFDVALEGRETIQDFGDRQKIHTNLTGDAVASNGTIVRFHHAFTIELDFVENTMTVTGLAFGASVEGTSIKRMDRGRLVIDLGSGQPIFVAGTWPPGPPNPAEATCQLIAAAQA
ncbi:MAG: hypothetical protein ACRDKA_00740 [Actinomycetota bacterium]